MSTTQSATIKAGLLADVLALNSETKKALVLLLTSSDEADQEEDAFSQIVWYLARMDEEQRSKILTACKRVFCIPGYRF